MNGGGGEGRQSSRERNKWGFATNKGFSTANAYVLHFRPQIFNIIAFETNESMKRLAIVSIIFLPITFVAGGMTKMIPITQFYFLSIA